MKYSVLGDLVPCSYCPLVFTTTQGRAAHEYQVHGIKASARRYVDETNVCFWCLKKFATRLGAVRHLTATKGCCLERIVARMEPLSEMECARLDVLACANQKNAKMGMKNVIMSRLPVLQTLGPRMCDACLIIEPDEELTLLSDLLAV